MWGRIRVFRNHMFCNHIDNLIYKVTGRRPSKASLDSHPSPPLYPPSPPPGPPSPAEGQQPPECPSEQRPLTLAEMALGKTHSSNESGDGPPSNHSHTDSEPARPHELHLWLIRIEPFQLELDRREPSLQVLCYHQKNGQLKPYGHELPHPRYNGDEREVIAKLLGLTLKCPRRALDRFFC